MLIFKYSLFSPFVQEADWVSKLNNICYFWILNLVDFWCNVIEWQINI